MAGTDLGFLPPDVRSQVKVHPNGEVSWPVDAATAALTELAHAGRVVLGLDVRDYDEDGSFVEVAWSVYDGSDPVEARDAALATLAANDLPGDQVLITWRS